MDVHGISSPSCILLEAYLLRTISLITISNNVSDRLYSISGWRMDMLDSDLSNQF